MDSYDILSTHPNFTQGEPLPRETRQLRSTMLLHPAILPPKSVTRESLQEGTPNQADTSIFPVHSEVALHRLIPSGYQV